MLTKYFIICSFTLSTFACLQAEGQNSPAQLIQIKSEEEIPPTQQLKSEEESEQSTLAECTKCGHKKGRNYLTIGTETEQSTLAECAKCGHKKNRKNLTPGVLVCNGKEDKCIKEEDNDKEAPTADLFAVFCDDEQDELNLLACKDCQ